MNPSNQQPLPPNLGIILFIIFFILPIVYFLYIQFFNVRFFKYSVSSKGITVVKASGSQEFIPIEQIISIKSVSYVSFFLSFLFDVRRKVVLVETLFLPIVRIETKDTRYYISPVDQELFCRTVRSFLK